MKENYQDWLYFDYRDLNLDFRICIDRYIKEEHDEIHKEIAKLRYYDKKTSQEVSSMYHVDTERIIKHIQSRLISFLKSRGWEEYQFNGGKKNE
ncbi:MAG: hypothetical protein AB7S75_01505 [Desulfococcaceae bacterium]